MDVDLLMLKISILQSMQGRTPKNEIPVSRWKNKHGLYFTSSVKKNMEIRIIKGEIKKKQNSQSSKTPKFDMKTMYKKENVHKT